MTADALQALMQHKDYQTTQRYINMARQLKPGGANPLRADAGRGGKSAEINLEGYWKVSRFSSEYDEQRESRKPFDSNKYRRWDLNPHCLAATGF